MLELVVFFVSVLGGLILLSTLGTASWVVSLGITGCSLLDYPVFFFVDSLGILMCYMLVCCGLVSLCYCFHYGGLSMRYLSLMMLWFLVVMMLLSLSGSMLLTLVLWEYLGLVSFFLILYYSNLYGLRASLVTLASSRFGDVSLFFILVWFDSGWYAVVGLCVVSLVLVVSSKSASFPFFSWLLEAMRAPTPVSSLVHSSTLVAAGVWFMLRYSHMLGDDVKGLLFISSMVSIIVSGLCGLAVDDLKKMVALSTCSNISWCVVYFVYGEWWLCVFQLLVHGLCKCYLFVSVGDLMSCGGSSQSIVGVYSSRYSGFYGLAVRLVLVVSLCGLPFLGLFFGKHVFFISVTYCSDFVALGLLFMSLFLTYCYSFRFLFLLLGVSPGLSFSFGEEFVFSGVFALFGSVIGCVGKVWLPEVCVMSHDWSVIFVFVQLMGFLSGWLVYRWSLWRLSGFPSVIFGSDVLLWMIYGLIGWVSRSFMVFSYRWESCLIGYVYSGVVDFTFSSFVDVFRVGFLVYSILVCACVVFVIS